jgi:hypothetical protein
MEFFGGICIKKFVYIMGKFQMIKPYPSDKIYESSNINKCAKKFYSILKQIYDKFR